MAPAIFQAKDDDGSVQGGQHELLIWVMRRIEGKLIPLSFNSEQLEGDICFPPKMGKVIERADLEER